MKWEVIPSERGSLPELHSFIEQRLSPVAMYRFRNAQWEYRPGYGEPWCRGTKPAAPSEMITQAEGRAA